MCHLGNSSPLARGEDVREVTGECAAAADAARFVIVTVPRRSRAGLDALPPQGGWFSRGGRPYGDDKFSSAVEACHWGSVVLE
jgi:hypothetical protein